MVVHSLTKFIGGASDHISGAICADKAFIHELMDLHTGALMLLGPTMDPQVAFNLNLRLPHLPLRMAEHGRRAMMFAQSPCWVWPSVQIQNRRKASIFASSRLAIRSRRASASCQSLRCCFATCGVK